MEHSHRAMERSVRGTSRPAEASRDFAGRGRRATSQPAGWNDAQSYNRKGVEGAARAGGTHNVKDVKRTGVDCQNPFSA
jgi:hypothetical protein